MKIKLLNILLSLTLCLSCALVLFSCNNTTSPNNTESGFESGEEETSAPPLDIADADDLIFVVSEDGTYYSVYALTHESGAKKIVIPSEHLGLPVKAIFGNAFEGCIPLEEIIIPDTVTHIGEYALDGCTNLKIIDMPADLLYVGEGAFDNCSSIPLTEYNGALYLGDKDAPYTVLISTADQEIEICEIHADTRIIYDYAFYECTELDDVIIPSGIEHIGVHVFEDCYDLFPTDSDYENAYYLGNNDNPYLVLVAAKGKRDLTSINIHGDTEIIAPGAFEGCTNLTSVTIPDSVRLICNYAFEGCTSLTNIDITDSEWTISQGEDTTLSINIKIDEDFTNRLTEIYYYFTWRRK